MSDSGSTVRNDIVPKDPDQALKDDLNTQIPPKGFVARLEHFTWANFTLPMATGGLSLLLSPSTQPHIFNGLNTIGKVIYIWDLLIFTCITIGISYRFIRWPHTLKASIVHPTEGLFFATFFLSFASIIAGMARYGIPSTGPWLIVVYRVLYWIYFACTFCTAVGQYTLLFTSPELKIQDMTPAWDLPIFPFMLCGTIAASGASYQPPSQSVPMIIAGLLAQGLGFLVSMLMYASYFRRMIQWGFPSANSRPGMFIAVGPPSFTALALIGMANDFPRQYINYFGIDSAASLTQSDAITVQTLRVLATTVACFIYTLSLWFFFISVIANFMARSQLSFHLNWYAYVFPNVGFVIASISIGKMLQSQGILWLGSVMSALLVALYLFIGACHIRAVLRREIMWPGKDEDVYRKEARNKEAALMQRGKAMDEAQVEKQD